MKVERTPEYAARDADWVHVTLMTECGALELSFPRGLAAAAGRALQAWDDPSRAITLTTGDGDEVSISPAEQP